MKAQVKAILPQALCCHVLGNHGIELCFLYGWHALNALLYRI